MKYLRTTLQILLPLVVLALGAFLAMKIVANRQQPIIQAPDKLGPLVRYVLAEPAPARLDVHTRGTVEPLRIVELAAEVSGRIVGTHANLRAGGTFTPDDVLVEIDATDYRLAISQQEASVARAELKLQQELAEAEAAINAWRKLEGEREADPLVRREPQIAEARKSLAAAKAMLERAHVDLQRTKVKLPFHGRVRSVHADIGQTVQRSQRLAVVLDTSELEVRLPIPLHDAGFVDLPLGQSTDDGPEVTLAADFAGKQRTWAGRIVRIEGELDRKTRQLTAIARVPGSGDDPLLVGMFVAADIVGRQVDQVFSIPRGALFDRDRVWVVTTRTGDDGNTTHHLTRRQVEVLRAERDVVLVQSGLAIGERVCTSQLQAPVDDMLVRLVEPAADEPEERQR